MKTIEDLLENTYQPDLDSLEATAKGFHPNTLTDASTPKNVQNIGYDFESNMIGISHYNDNEDFDYLVALSNGEQNAYAVCQIYNGEDTVFWLFEDNSSYWLNDSELQETGRSSEDILGLNLTDLDKFKSDYRAQKKKYVPMQK